MKNFLIPSAWNSYHREVVKRSHQLIDRGIWQGVDQTNLEGWLNNFRTSEEKYLAACLLDNFVYRSKKQIAAMYKYLFNVILPNYCRKAGNRKQLKQTNAYFAPLDSGTPGTSEHVYFRLLKSTVKIPRNLRIHISKSFLQSNPKFPIVLIDDFCGTGDTFEKFAKKYELNLYSNLEFFFCPLIAHDIGSKRISSDYKNVKVVPVETIREMHQSFSINSTLFADPATAKSFYLEFVHSKGITAEKDPLGYGDQALALAFEESIPNETLPIFWSDKIGCPLIRRA